MKKALLSEKIKNKIVHPDSLPEGVTKISFSQYSIYKDCKYRWYLTYGKRNFMFNSSIDTVFGTALHETLQQYLNILYNSTIKESESFNYKSFLYDSLIKTYQEEKIKNDDNHFTTKELLNEYYEDGVAILKYIITNRVKYFDTKNLELVGIEIPLLTRTDSANDNIWFQAYIDVIFYDKFNNCYIIIDIKTSKNGWSDYQKKDEKKAAQLLLYKSYFSKQFGVPEESIDVKFMIVKRKPYENPDYPTTRVQHFLPANGKHKMKAATTDINQFIHECFDYDGKIIDKEYPKNPGDKQYNCKYCPFNSSDLCDKRN